MKYIMQLVLAVCLSGGSLLAAEKLPAFDKFYKTTMKVTPGAFTVYQDGDRYFLEIPAKAMEKDILVIGDVAQGYTNVVAPSSGVIRFSTGDSTHLNIIRQEYKEAVSRSFNQEMEPLVQLSNLVPVSFVVRIEAYGKEPGSYIIDLTRNLKEGGQFFSFRDISALSRPDPDRSGVQAVSASADAVTFSVLRTQTDQSGQGGKKMEVANAFILHLTFQLLPERYMQGREADPRIGYTTVSYNDFGKNPYGVRNVKLIRKWNLSVKAADTAAYRQGILVKPASPVTVYIDKKIPAFFVPYVEKAIVQWNGVFAAAGFKEVFRVSRAEDDNCLLYGKLLIKWGNAFEKVETAVIEDPRSGEILTGKMTICEQLLDPLLNWYFAACALQDSRIMQQLSHAQVKGDLMEWVVANAMGSLLGLDNNYCGSTAYTTAQLRSAAWVRTHGITASVTDGISFNYAGQAGDQLPVTSLIAHTGAYDSLAIGWGYRLFNTEQEAAYALKQLAYNNAAWRYLPQSNTDPFTQRLDLGADAVNASAAGLKNIAALYPKLDSITGAMPGGDESWEIYQRLADAMIKTYDGYLKNVLWQIGGRSERPVFKGYNETPVVYVSKKEQYEAFAFLRQYLFNGVPAWMKNKRTASAGGEPLKDKFERMADAVLNRLLNMEVIASLVAAENANGREVFSANDLFALIDNTVFDNYSTTRIPEAFHISLQRSFVNALIQSVSKNPVFNGLNGANEVLHLYFVRTLKNIDRLSKTHVHPLTRTRYQLLKSNIEKEYIKKPL